MKNKQVIIMVGLPGSGKSTYVKDVLLNTGLNYTVCSSDDIIDAKATELNITNTEAFELCSRKETERAFKEKIWAAIDAGDNIIIDRTNLTEKGRSKMISYFNQRKATNYKKIAIVFDMTDLNMIYKRCEDRFKSTGKYISVATFSGMISRYDEVKINEFDEIINIK